jgi:hypothetical protein
VAAWAVALAAVPRVARPQARALRLVAARLQAVVRWVARAGVPQRRRAEAPLCPAPPHRPAPEAVRPQVAAERNRADRLAEVGLAEMHRAKVRGKVAAAHRERRAALQAAGSRVQRKHPPPGNVARPARPLVKHPVDGKVVQKREALGSPPGAGRRHPRVEAGQPALEPAPSRLRGAGVARRARGLAPGARFRYPVRSAQSAVTLK